MLVSFIMDQAFVLAVEVLAVGHLVVLELQSEV